MGAGGGASASPVISSSDVTPSSLAATARLPFEIRPLENQFDTAPGVTPQASAIFWVLIFLVAISCLMRCPMCIAELCAI